MKFRLITIFILVSLFAGYVGAPFVHAAIEIPAGLEIPEDETGLTNSEQSQIDALDYASSVNESDIDVILNPEYPNAFQPVSIRLDSNTIDLNRYFIQWVVNGVSQKSGIGLRDFKITSGNYGSNTRVDAIVRVEAGVTLQKQIVISPQDATVLWEAIDSYVPPFYRGKKLPGQESLIKISAMPNFKLNNSSLKLDDAVYLWSRNDNRILNVGGYAKDSIIIQHNKLRASEKITATVSDVDGGTKTEKSIVLPIRNPEIHWYYKNTDGYRKLLAIDRGLRITSGDTTLVAEPYFFSSSAYTDDLTYTWKVNNETLYLEPGSIKKELLVQNPGQNGQATFSIALENPKTFLQSAASTISLYFQSLKQ